MEIRREKRERRKREGKEAAVLSSRRASRHMAAPSLGHYASLSFVVIGREKRTGDTSQSKQMRDFSVGAAFSRDLAI